MLTNTQYDLIILALGVRLPVRVSVEGEEMLVNMVHLIEVNICGTPDWGWGPFFYIITKSITRVEPSI